MESITIKRSTQPYRSVVLLVIVLIPVILFSYAMFDSRGSSSITFGIIAILFLLPVIIDFIANRMIRLKAAITLSEHCLILSSSKGLYDSFAFLQIFQRRYEKVIEWQKIKELTLSVHYKYPTSYPDEVSVSTTYSVARHQLCIESNNRNNNIIFSVHDLDEAPDEILRLCNYFLRKYGNDEREICLT